MFGKNDVRYVQAFPVIPGYIISVENTDLEWLHMTLNHAVQFSVAEVSIFYIMLHVNSQDGEDEFGKLNLLGRPQ